MDLELSNNTMKLSAVLIISSVIMTPGTFSFSTTASAAKETHQQNNQLKFKIFSHNFAS